MNNAEVLIKFKGDTKDVDTKTKSLSSSVTSKMGAVAKGIGKAFAVASVASVTAIGAITKASVDAYAEYEQLVGGVETLFKDSSEMVREYADQAFLTAGLSANEYMSTVTSFSASLLQSLGGDTKKAAEYSDRAVRDMADNANKMGTNISMIQNAYQGFAKQNYMMLDNLKLGYGGTKTEMERLISDASKLTDVQKELGVTVDANDISFGNIVNAISVIQKEMGIMGTTSKEASTTIQGSLNSMRASWQNLLIAFSDGTYDLNSMLDSFVGTVETFLGNVLPVVERVLTRVAQALPGLINKIGAKLPSLLTNIIPSLIQGLVGIINAIIQALPTLINVLLPPLIQGVVQIATIIIQMLPEIITMIADMLPTLMPMIIDSILSLIPLLIENIPVFMSAGHELIKGLVVGIINSVPDILQAGWEIIKGLVRGIGNGFASAINKIKELGKSIINKFKSLLGIKSPSTVFNSIGKNLVQGLINGIGSLISKVKQKAGAIVTGIKSKFTGIKNAMHNIGTNVAQGIGNGITAGTQWVKNKVSNLVGNVTSFIKKAFKIGSPSKLMAQEVGQWIPKGIAVGITANSDAINKSMDDIQKQISMSMGMSPQVANSTALNYSPNISVNNQISMKQDPLGQMVSNIKTFSGGAKNDYNYGASV